MSVSKTATFLQERLNLESPPLLLVLGSGWGEAVERLIETEAALGYEEIPGFPVSTVAGHAGRLVVGRVAGRQVLIMQGRFHYYEGYSMQEITFPIRVFKDLGGQALFLTNAAGGIDAAFSPGDLMVIRDHLNLMGDNPLRGPNEDRWGPRFPDMTSAWDADLREVLHTAGAESGVMLQEGVYCAVSGPNFETPAEVRAFAFLGANAVGMSTVPECLVARHMGLRVVGLSCITNVAAYDGGDPLSHEEVGEVAQRARAGVGALMGSALPKIVSLLTA